MSSVGKKTSSKKVAPLPKSLSAEKPIIENKAANKKKNAYSNLITSEPRNFGIGQCIQPKRDLTRFVRWPKYVRLQRQKVVLKKRLKIPPVLNQFSNTLDKNSAISLFRLLDKHVPETPLQKKERILKEATYLKEKGEKLKTPKPITIKSGINHVTALIEEKKAKLVVIASDVDPIEYVLWLPALCVKMGVPYCIVKNKSRLGKLVHMKTATAICLTEVKPAYENEFTAITNLVNSKFNERYDTIRRQWGGSLLGKKSRDAIQKKIDRGLVTK